MTMILVLRCKDGVVVATDGKVSRASTAYRAVARIWQKTNKTFLIAPRTLVAGAGEVEMIRRVVDVLQNAPAEARAKGIDGLLEIARAEVVTMRAAAVARLRAIYGAEAANLHAPRAYFIFSESTPKPRLVYLAEDGESEDQSHFGYASVGVGDLVTHVRMQAFDPTQMTTEQGAILAFGIIKDAVESGTFRVSDPVQIWTARENEEPLEWDESRLAKLAEQYHLFMRKMNEVLLSM